MSRRINLSQALALLGAALVVLSLFLSWFADSNAFEAFEALDLLLLALAGLAAAAALDRLGRARDARPALAAGLGVIAVVLLQLIEPPPGFGDDEVEAGAWLGLAGGFLMATGALLALASINVTVDVRGRDGRSRMAAVDRRDAGAAAPAGHPADSLFTEPVAAGDGPEPGAPAPSEPLPAADAVADDDRTQPMRPVPPDDAAGTP